MKRLVQYISLDLALVITNFNLTNNIYSVKCYMAKFFSGILYIKIKR